MRLAVAFVAVLAVARVASAVDPLPSWNDGPAKQAILRFVADVTEPEGPRFVPVEERIAVFDNDGTLIAEQPLFFQFYFFLQRIRELAPLHPEWKEKQPFKAVLENDLAYLDSISRDELGEIVLRAASGVTEREYVASVERFLAEVEHPDRGVPFTRLVYQPMIELVTYLREKGFRVYIVSAAAPELIRAFSEKVFGIPREQVIGSDMQMRFDDSGERPELWREPAFVRPINERAGKPINIDRAVGRSPILAFGNSDGDIEMLSFTAYSGRPKLALLLHHDDAEREYGYEDGTQEALAVAKERGWIVVSMKESFRRVFPPEKRK
jgi:HAD superfamily phosphoserine phosphatase-like hydrolase